MSTVRKEIEAVLAATEAALLKGASAKELAALMYDESVVAVSEGATPVRGLEELLPRIAEITRDWGSHPRVALKVCEPVLSAESVAVTMVNVEIHPDTPNAAVLRHCAFMGWKRSSRGWRVALEMINSGVI